jgi:ketosteroid isomerase-like protein
MVMVENERSFAKAVAKVGMRDGFLRYIADSGVLFVPGAVNGKELYEGSSQRPGHLSWGPEHAEIAEGDNLGWTTGPWEFRRETANDTPHVFGHYVTLWKLQANSEWKFVLDIGISHSRDSEIPQSPNLNLLQKPRRAASVNGANDQSELLEFENELSAQFKNGNLIPSYLANAADDIRYYRDGESPHHGTAAVKAELLKIDGPLQWQPDFSAVSQSGALGYTYGVCSQTSNDSTTQFSYTHIWRRSDSGKWALALDIQIPLPKTDETK